MQALERISSVWAAPWVAWVMLALLMLACTAMSMQPAGIWKTFIQWGKPSPAGSLHPDMPASTRGQGVMRLFILGVVAMAAYMLVQTYTGSARWEAPTYGRIMVAAAVVGIIKMAIDALAGLAFVQKDVKETLILAQHQSAAWAAAAQYVVILMGLYSDIATPGATYVATATIAAAYAISSMVSKGKALAHGLKGWIYTAIYCITMDIVPLIAITALAIKIVTKETI